MNEYIEPKENDGFFFFFLKYVYDKPTNTIKPFEYPKPSPEQINSDLI